MRNSCMLPFARYITIFLMLTTTAAMFAKAYKGGYAVGAFNVNNMEIVQGIMAAASEKKSAVILQVSAGARKYAHPVYLRKLVEAATEINPEIPVALHLDHGADFEICKSCVDSGFSSVMIDGSHHAFEENIALVKQVVEYAHAHGVVVEAELGRLEGVEDDVKVASGEGSYTDPAQAVEFVQRTGVDSLAVAIGTNRFPHPRSGRSNKLETRKALNRAPVVGNRIWPLGRPNQSVPIRSRDDDTVRAVCLVGPVRLARLVLPVRTPR